MAQQYGKFRLHKRVGEGAFAEVWLADAGTLEGERKRVALKIVKTDASQGSEETLQSTLNEAFLGAKLQHPCVVEVYEFGTIQRRLYIAMEYVDGLTLEAWLRRRKNRPLPLPVALQIGAAMAEALAFAHSQSSSKGEPQPIVHRDIKPGNVMVSWDGRIKLVDFGIAQYTDNVFQTAGSGKVQGSPLYMSPEQIDRPRDVGPSSDLFSFATVMIEMLTGRNPYEAGTLLEVLDAVRFKVPQEALEAVRQKAPGLSAVLKKLVAKREEDRLTDTGEVARALAELCRRHPPERGLDEEVGEVYGETDGEGRERGFYSSSGTLRGTGGWSSNNLTQTDVLAVWKDTRRWTVMGYVGWTAVLALAGAVGFLAYQILLT